MSRAAADPDFFYKIAVECGIDALIIMSVNYVARGDSFWDELEFVFCQVLLPRTSKILARLSVNASSRFYFEGWKRR
jgi:hypothetical protein